MHVVYKITFNDRIKEKIKPYYYIGSKSNCLIHNDILYCKKNGKQYKGSCKSKLFKEAILIEKNLTYEFLEFHENYKNCVEAEYNHQIKENVVLSSYFFNCAFASKNNNFHDPNYISARHIETGKVCRILKEDMTEEWVGASSGMKWFNDGNISKMFFDGRQPSGWNHGRIYDFENTKNNFTKNQTQEKLIAKRSKTWLDQGGRKGQVWNKGLSKKDDERLKRSKETIEKMKNKPKLYGKENPMYGKIWITNGIESKIIPKGDFLPYGYRLGRTRKSQIYDAH